jgi:CubicO group peptidase (beta-lactamase class C family)
MLRIAIAAAVLAITGCSTATSPAPQTVTAQASWNAAALAEIVSYAQSQKTTGFLIIQDGRTITEHNWPLPDDAASKTFGANFVHGSAGGALREDVASQQKSFVALLIGIGVDKGLIDIEKPVTSYIGAGWSKATPEQEGAITVRHLLEMNSGLKENLTYEAPAGTKFFYNTPAYAILKPVLEKASGENLRNVTQLWLTKRINMHDTAWEQRPAAFADAGNPTGLATTPRDIAIMGQLVLDRGMFNGGRVISEAQLDAMFAPTQTNPAYGRLWWLNTGAYSLNPGAAVPRREGRFIPSAPADTLSALGAQDRKLFVAPSQKLIVVRTGQATPDRDFNEKLWSLIAKAAPQH